MKKFLAVLVIVSLVLGASASASVTKLMSLGGLPVQLTNLDQIVNIYPSLINNNKNIAVTEMAFGNLFAYTFIDTPLGVVGLTGAPNPGIPQEPYVVGFHMPDFFSNATFNPYVTGAFYGTKMGGMELGGYLLYGQRISDFNEHTFDKVKDSYSLANYSYVKVNGGASLNVGMPLDASLAITIPGRIHYNTQYRNFDANGHLQEEAWIGDSIVDYDVNARTVINGWIINGEFGLANGVYEDVYMFDANDNQKFTDAGDTYDITKRSDLAMRANILTANTIKASDTLSITIGTGLNCAFTGTGQVQTFEDKVAKTTTKTYPATITNTNEYIIPLYVAATCKLNETWSFNAGVAKTVVDLKRITTITQNTTTGKKTDEYQDTSLLNTDELTGAMGVTGVIGDLSVDLLLNPNILVDGPYFLSGANNNLAYSIAFNYKWGK